MSDEYGKQAKILTKAQQQQLLDWVSHSRYPIRDRAIVLLSFRAGLRVKEISSLTWSMVIDAAGDVSDLLELPSAASKGKRGGRHIALHPELRQALLDLRQSREDWQTEPHQAIIHSERGDRLGNKTLSIWFGHRYRELGFTGASSHSGRRTFITTLAKKIALIGGSIRDVQQLAGHSRLEVTQRYIEGDAEAKRKAINLL